jgi:hypothetical protein
LASKGLGCDRWALDKRFAEATLSALGDQDDRYPFILPEGRRPRTSLLIEIGRWGDERSIRIVAANIEEAASQKQGLSVKEAISISQKARLEVIRRSSDASRQIEEDLIEPSIVSEREEIEEITIEESEWDRMNSRERWVAAKKFKNWKESQQWSKK